MNWIYLALILVGTIFNIKKQRVCFLIWAITITGWAIIEFKEISIAQILAGMIFVAMCFYGWLAWGKQKEKEIVKKLISFDDIEELEKNDKKVVEQIKNTPLLSPETERKFKEKLAKEHSKELSKTLKECKKDLKEDRYWGIINELDWGREFRGRWLFKKLGKQLASTHYSDIEELEKFAKDKRKDLVSAIKIWEKKNNIQFPCGDDGFWDLTAHIVGLGKEEYYKNLKNPKLAYGRAKADDYKENFEYVFNYAKEAKKEEIAKVNSSSKNKK
jgi:hypothetical protein